MPIKKLNRLLNQDRGQTVLGTACDFMNNATDVTPHNLMLHTTNNYHQINSRTLIFREPNPNRNVQLHNDAMRVNHQKNNGVPTRNISSITPKKPKPQPKPKKKVPKKSKRRFKVQL